MACLCLDWLRAPHVHVLIFWRDRPRARCIGRVRLAALALPPGLNFGAGKSSISATMQNLSMQDEALRSGEQARAWILFWIRSGRLLRSEIRQNSLSRSASLYLRHFGWQGQLLLADEIEVSGMTLSDCRMGRAGGKTLRIYGCARRAEPDQNQHRWSP
jgi:hypothetical protein